MANSLDKAEICSEFEIKDFDGQIIHGEIDNEGYEGRAAILFVNDGKLYWAGGSHCSCYGFEGQWDPDETSIKAVRHISENGYGIEQRVATKAVEIIDTFGIVEDGDALNAAVQLYFAR
jgi:hypothetical protein